MYLRANTQDRGRAVTDTVTLTEKKKLPRIRIRR